MADLATLQIAVDSRPVTKAAGELDTLTASAGRTGTSVDKLTAANQRMAAAFATSNKPLIDATRYLTSMQVELERVGKSSLQIKVLEAKMAAAAAPTRELAQEIRNTAAELIRAERAAAGAKLGAVGTQMGAVAGRTKLASHEITNLAFQFQDLGVQIAGGANPLVALAQQGSQVSGIMMQSGMSVGTFTKAVGSMIATATKAVVLNPIFLSIAAAIGVFSAGWSVLQTEINKSADLNAYAKSLGLTKEEIEKVGGASVTTGDMVKGLWKTISDGLNLSGIFKTIVGWFKSFGEIVIDVAKVAGASLYAAFVGSFNAIRIVWNNFPAVMSDVFTKAANAAITSTEWLVNKIIEGINRLAGSPLLDPIKFNRLANQNAGAAARVGKQIGSAYTDAFDTAMSGMSKFRKQWDKNTIDFAKERLRSAKDEEKAKKAKEKSNAEAERAARELAKSLEELYTGVLDGLHITMRETLKTIQAITDGDVTQMMDEINKRRDAGIQKTKQEAEERRKVNDELGQTADYLDSLFGLQGNLGGLFKAMRSGFDDVFNSLSNAFGGLKTSLEGLLANMGSSFAKVAAGASIGGIAAGATGGSQLGGMAGGAIGQAIGSKVLGKALGTFAGPLGSIAGGLLGGLIGGLFAGTKQASATISSIGGQAALSKITGNNAELKGVANNMATGLLSGLSQIAKQLGGQLGGAVSLSIGQRNKDFVVDPTGQGRTKGAGVINFKEDQAAAIAYATQLAIQQGIFTGLSAGANTLIKAGGDLQAQLEKALQFDQVFKDLRAETDPLGYELENLAREMADLQAVFREAGATAADYAALEELYAIKRRRATFEAERPRRELEIQLMEATGDAAGALAAQRALELEAMDATLRGLQQQVWAAQDTAAANAAAAEEAAFVAQQRAEAEAAAAAEAARAREEAARRVEEAENALRQAYEREASVFQDTISKFRDLARTLREFAATIIPLNGTGRASISELNRKFYETAALARLGNVEAMGALPGIGGELRDAIVDTATDRVSMIRRLNEVKKETEAVADVADRQISIAQQQLDALTTQVEQFVTLNESVLSVRDAIGNLQAARSGLSAAGGASSGSAAPPSMQSQVSGTVSSGLTPAQKLYMDTMMSRQGYGTEAEIKSYVSQLGDAQALASLAVINGTYDQLKSENGYTQAANIASYYNVPVVKYANGGIHSGGLRLVGENGPELEATGPSRIYNANQLGNMMNGSATAEEVKALRDELKVVMFQIAKNTGKTSDQLSRWDGDGLPDARGY